MANTESPGPISFGANKEVNKLIGRDRKFTLDDLAKCTGSGQTFFARSKAKIQVFMDTGVIVTDGDVKKILEEFTPEKMGKISDQFKKALAGTGDDEKDNAMVALAHKFSKYDTLLAGHEMASSQMLDSATTIESESRLKGMLENVQSLRQTSQAAAAVKRLGEIKGIDLLQSAALEGAQNSNGPGPTGIGRDFLTFCKVNEKADTITKENIEDIYQEFIGTVKEKAISGALNVKGYPSDRAVGNLYDHMRADINFESINENDPFHDIKNMDANSLMKMIKGQAENREFSLSTINTFKELLKNKDYVADDLKFFFSRPEIRPMLKEILKDTGIKDKDFQLFAKPPQEDSLKSQDVQAMVKIHNLVNRAVEYLKNEENQRAINDIAVKYGSILESSVRQEQLLTTQDKKDLEEIKKSLLNLDLALFTDAKFSELMSNKIARPLLNQIFETTFAHFESHFLTAVDEFKELKTKGDENGAKQKAREIINKHVGDKPESINASDVIGLEEPKCKEALKKDEFPENIFDELSKSVMKLLKNDALAKIDIRNKIIQEYDPTKPKTEAKPQTFGSSNIFSDLNASDVGFDFLK